MGHESYENTRKEEMLLVRLVAKNNLKHFESFRVFSG